MEIETARLYVVSDASELLEPGNAPGPGARKNPTVPADIETDTAVDVADRLDEVAWRVIT